MDEFHIWAALTKALALLKLVAWISSSLDSDSDSDPLAKKRDIFVDFLRGRLSAPGITIY